VGDLATPHEEYKQINCVYIDPYNQETKYKDLSDAIGWKSIQRRNIGFVEAWRMGADIVATVDDDNIPYDGWGEDLLLGREIEVDCWKSDNGVFDPLSIIAEGQLWHRGYPIQLIETKNKTSYLGKIKKRFLVQADLWNGDPDIDAMARIVLRPEVNFPSDLKPYCSVNISPFNSQNTFLSREILPFYSVLPFVGRMDDIWGGYILQHYFPGCVVYNKASVYQKRNEQNLVTNLENEIIGYNETENFITDLSNYDKYLPFATKKFVKEYRAAIYG
jgi:hypothetical protein